MKNIQCFVLYNKVVTKITLHLPSTHVVDCENFDFDFLLYIYF